MDYGGVISESREVGRRRKIFYLKEGMAVGMKLVCTGSNKTRDEICVGED